MVLSIANKNRNRNKNRSCGTTVVFAVYIDGYAQNTHTQIHVQTHTYTDTYHISIYAFSLRIFNYMARRQRKKWKANLHKPKPQTTHTQAIKLKPIPALPPLLSSLSFFIFTHIFSDCFLGLSWIICSPLCVFSLFRHKAFCNWIMTSKSVWHLLLFFL